MSLLYVYHDSMPLYISRNAVLEAAWQLKILSEYVDKLLLLAKDMHVFTIELLYMLVSHSAIPDKTNHMLMAYKENLERMYKDLIERLDFAIKVFNSIIEEAKKKQQQG